MQALENTILNHYGTKTVDLHPDSNIQITETQWGEYAIIPFYGYNGGGVVVLE